MTSLYALRINGGAREPGKTSFWDDSIIEDLLDIFTTEYFSKVSSINSYVSPEEFNGIFRDGRLLRRYGQKTGRSLGLGYASACFSEIISINAKFSADRQVRLFLQRNFGFINEFPFIVMKPHSLQIVYLGIQKDLLNWLSTNLTSESQNNP